MPLFHISARGGDQATVEAANWLTALGLGLDRLGVVGGLDRLACEVLPNGTVIARDARSGRGFVVQPDREQGKAKTPGAHLHQDDQDAPMVVGGAEDDLDEDTEVFVLEEDSSALLPETLPPATEIDTTDLTHQAVLHLVDAIRELSLTGATWQVAVEVAQELVPSDAASGLQLEADGGLRFVVATGPEAHKLAGVRIPSGKGLAAFSVARGMGLVVNNPERDHRFYREMDAATGFATRSILCVPVAANGRSFGCIELLNPPGEQLFDREDLDLVEQVARALGDRLSTPS